ETLPQAARTVPFTVSAGDTVTISLTQQSTGDWLVSFDNRTTGQHYQLTETYACSLSSAEWVEEAPFMGRQMVPLDNFGSVHVTEAFAVKDGNRVTIAQAGGKAIHMIDQAGQPVATTSTLGSDGASFTITREADAAASGLPPDPALPGRSRRGN